MFPLLKFQFYQIQLYQHLFKSSTKLPPFIKTPFLDAPPIPANKPRGIEITRAHGHETTRNTNAL